MNAQHLDWSDLRLVLAVGGSGSLSGAARALGVNHSTVFRRINALEEKLAVRLFERLAQGYVLTAAGEEMVAAAARIEEEVNALERQLTGQDLRLSGTLRVATTDTLALRLLMPCFAQFQQRYPGIQLELNIANVFVSLSKREADVAIRPTQTPPETLVGRRLCGIATAVYGAIDYLNSHPEADLASHDWLAPDDSLAHLPAARWLARTYPQARIGLRSNTLLGLLEAAKAGLGIVALPCFLGDSEPALRRLTPPDDELATALWLLTHADLRHTARVRAFMDFMAQAIAAQRALLEGYSHGFSTRTGAPCR